MLQVHLQNLLVYFLAKIAIYFVKLTNGKVITWNYTE